MFSVVSTIGRQYTHMDQWASTFSLGLKPEKTSKYIVAIFINVDLIAAAALKSIRDNADSTVKAEIDAFITTFGTVKIDIKSEYYADIGVKHMNLWPYLALFKIHPLTYFGLGLSVQYTK